MSTVLPQAITYFTLIPIKRLTFSRFSKACQSRAQQCSHTTGRASGPRAAASRLASDKMRCTQSATTPRQPKRERSGWATVPSAPKRRRRRIAPARPTPHAKRLARGGDWHDLVAGERMIRARRHYLRGTMTKVAVACAEALAVTIIVS